MAVDIQEYSRLKARAERSRSEADRAQGVLDGLMKNLKADFEVDTLEEAEKLLDEYQEQEKKAEESYRKELADFESKWGERI